MDGRSVGGRRSVYGHVITKFSGMGRFTCPWCSAGTRFARENSAINLERILAREMAFQTNCLWCLAILFVCGKAEGGEESASVAELPSFTTKL